MVKNSSVDGSDSLCGTGATQAWNADSGGDTCAKGLAITDSANAEHARDANAGRVSDTDANFTSHAQHADARRLAKPSSVSPDEYAGHEHAHAFGESVGEPIESNARNGNAGHGKKRNEHGTAGRDEWR